MWDGDLAFYIEEMPEKEIGHVMVVAPKPNTNELRKIILHFRENFRRPFWPLRIESVEKIPLSPNGKVNRNSLEKYHTMCFGSKYSELH